MRDFKEHLYRIEIDDNDHSVRSFYLDDQPIEYPDPNKVKVGAMVYWDKNNQNRGIVMRNDRRDEYFQLFDIFNVETEQTEEVAEFQLYLIAGE